MNTGARDPCQQPVHLDESFAHPFDQYQRYQDVRVAVQVIQSRLARDSLRILDVGGSPVVSRYLSGHRLVVANLEVEPGIALQCDGARLPCRDESCDVAISVDTLEHLADRQRLSLVDELLRSSAAYAILIAPFASGTTETAERTLYHILREALGQEHRFLLEHLQQSLPDLPACLDRIAQANASCVVIPSGYLQHWLPLMIIRHRLWQLPEGGALDRDLECLYNQQCYWADHRLPSYRQMIVISKHGDTETLQTVRDQLAGARQAEPGPPDLNGVIGLWQTLRVLPLLEERDAELAQLRQLVIAYQSGRFMRFMAALRRWLHRFRGETRAFPPNELSTD